MTRGDAARIRWGVAIHGGVGTIPEDRMTGEERQAYRAALAESLAAGHGALAEGGSAVDAVEAAVVVLEDSPLFNAGRGSNFDERGVITMDASIMEGGAGEGGAVASIGGVRNPVSLARRVMERSPHLFLVGEGAEAFARREGLETADAAWFATERRWQDLQRALERGAGARPNVLGDAGERSGTVGAVALDPAGRLAAATSTGGMAGKAWGRVGDTPILGAGTWAGPRCAVSCTGWGELFIRVAAAHQVHARMVFGGASLAEAVDAVVEGELHGRVPGSGGMATLGAEGSVVLRFNTPGMYRGWVDETGRPSVGIHGEPATRP